MHGNSAFATHVDKIQIVAKALAGARQADAPRVYAQDFGAEDDLVLIDKPFGIGRPQELSHLGGSRLAALLALPAEPRACEPSSGWGSVPAEIQQSKAPRGACWHGPAEAH